MNEEKERPTKKDDIETHLKWAGIESHFVLRDVQDHIERVIDARIKDFQSQLATVTDELEKERIRLACCGVAAMANTENTRADRITSENPYYSASYSDVCKAVDREMELRDENKMLRAALEFMTVKALKEE